MKVNLPQKFSQNDPRWKDSQLGFQGTIGNFGCTMNCATMTACYYGHNETPLTANEKLKANGGYSNGSQIGAGNLLVWGAVASIWKLKFSGKFGNSDLLTKANMDQIRGALDKGFPVFLQIDTVPQTSQKDEHWILAIDYDGDDFIVQDPWDGATKRITSWGVVPQKLIYEWCWYEGKVPQGGSDDVLMEIKKSERDWLVFRATTAKEVGEFLGLPDPDHAESSAYKNVINGFKSRSTDLEKQLVTASAEVKNRTEQVGRLKDEVTSEQKLRKELNDKLNEALKGSAGVVGVYEGQLKEKQGVIDQLGKDKGALTTENAILKNQLKEAHLGSLNNVSIFDVLSLLIGRIIPFLKKTKLKG